MSVREKKHIEGEIKEMNKSANSPVDKIVKMGSLVVIIILLLMAAIIPFTSVGKKGLKKVARFIGGKPEKTIVEKIVYKEKFIEVPKEVRIPEVGTFFEERKQENVKEGVSSEPVNDVRKLSGNSDIQLKTSVRFPKVESYASDVRTQAGSYTISYDIAVKLPEPVKNMAGLLKVNPELKEIFPKLEEYIEGAELSQYFEMMYANKTMRIKEKALDMTSLLSRHNFFDLQTILNFKTQSGRKVMLMQADMDVVSDGSDGDRLAKMPSSIVNSSYYQPSTSYFWKKQTDTPNPLIVGYEKRVGNANAELADPEVTETRRDWLKQRIKFLKTKIEDMKWHSYLIAEHDPFIVIPVNMLTDTKDPFAAKAGDYAVVVFKDKLYPCIVGDGGPSFKVGEASLRLAKEINKRSSSYSRPVSNLTVTYIVFPNSRDKKKSPPNYSDWEKKCAALIEEMGGIAEQYKLHEWKNTLPGG